MYEINNFTQKSEELTEKRNQTQEQLIKGKYLSLLPPLFFVVEYATSFQRVTREGKSIVFLKNIQVLSKLC